MTTVDRLPLEGIVVVDASRIIAGPFASQLLRDLGARVIKVEHPSTGDDARSYLRRGTRGEQVSPLFASMNRGKDSIGVDLASVEGMEVFGALVERADVFLHNFRPGVADRLGIDAAALLERNPALVYCDITGFGDRGPLRTKAANDIVAQAYSGLMSISGEPGGRPIRCPVQIADLSAGYVAAVGILGALFGRERTGRGAVVSTSLLEAMLSMLGPFVTDYLVTGVRMEPIGSRNRLGQPNQAFRTRDGYAVIGAVNEAMWQRCAGALGAPEWIDDERFASATDRVEHQDELVEAIEAKTAVMSTAELVHVLDAARVTCAPMNRLDELTDDAQFQALGMQGDATVDGCTVPLVGSPMRIDGLRLERGDVPDLGASTDELLEWLGYAAAEIAALRRSGTVR